MKLGTQGKKRFIITSCLLGLTLLVVGGIILFQRTSAPDKTNVITTTSPNSALPGNAAIKPDTPAIVSSGTAITPKSDTAPVDPSTLNSVDVAPLGVVVFYTKGVHGFDFEVKKTDSKTQYVEFSASELIGTICTDDNGSFASIVKNPTSAEDQTTITATTKLGDDSYGLSLSGKNCTANQQLLTQYQTAFMNGFSSLKAL